LCFLPLLLFSQFSNVRLQEIHAGPEISKEGFLLKLIFDRMFPNEPATIIFFGKSPPTGSLCKAISYPEGSSLKRFFSRKKLFSGFLNYFRDEA